MSFWKMLGGAAIGVGAIAAAPFTGGGSLLGAATLAGSLAGGATVAAAVGAGVAGAAVGASMDGEEAAEKRGADEAIRKTEAEYDLKYQKISAAFKDAEARLNDVDDYFNLIIAMEAVGLSCAACDGEIADEERAEIDEFINGIMGSALPAHIKSKIDGIANNPPNITTAFEYASKVSPESMGLFEEIIDVVMHADNHIHENETAFLEAWKKLAA
ncbi:hypothetical protein ACFFUS_09730 [Vibrio gallaecicus]|uniref:TerB family tellurite resistance protein n=1 Tax=Vibrio gallaecicus TaxID=552386 RepID=A0ABV4NGA5_9VIBR|nr:hypothetical protein [Vibrio gallaecicus]MDN3616669.1 hypothetical protein [Vibrio gallaecicus]